MADDRKLPDDVSIRSRAAQPRDDLDSQSSARASSLGAAPGAISGAATGAVNDASGSTANLGDVADEIPVPPAMSPAEIDERAQVVEALRGDQSRLAESAARATEAAGNRSQERADDATPPA